MSRRITSALLVMGLLSGCTTAKAAPNVIVLEVTGTATISSLTLIVDGTSSEETSVALPWNRTLEFPAESGGHEWKLVLRHSGGSVLATCTANGELLTQTAGSSSPGSDSSAQVSGSISP
ncbi:hypothetical protein OG205_01410 [Lentzea sp. NBC_00516]|uniref:hypothetical protein n=1 Tax=Lentzea sp. NBC_00516 TaxID=2903582 RepID=UPI002E810143|nr:hypothetical protein [Lentzea sp. NBC_00516]WUD25683.1 hypothetical protein OG205_01410 [Lentzea sp. NBC_00516]